MSAPVSSGQLCAWPPPYMDGRKCEGQRHEEGGPAHSYRLPDGDLVIWWYYGNDRLRRIVRGGGER